MWRSNKEREGEEEVEMKMKSKTLHIIRPVVEIGSWNIQMFEYNQIKEF